jgi:hypothetical protein
MALGAATGLAKGITSLVGMVKKRRSRKEEQARIAAIPSQNAAAGASPAPSAGSSITGQNPVAQAGMQSTQPTIIQPAALSAGQLKPAGVPNSLAQAKQNYLFRVAMDGDKL